MITLSSRSNKDETDIKNTAGVRTIPVRINFFHPAKIKRGDFTPRLPGLF